MLRKSTVLHCHWSGILAWPSKHSTEFPTEDGWIRPTPCAVSNTFSKLLPSARLAHYNLCFAAQPRPDPYMCLIMGERSTIDEMMGNEMKVTR